MIANSQIVFTGPNQIEIQEKPDRPLKAGEIRIETQFSLISAGTEGAWLKGDPWKAANGRTFPEYPHIPGYSNVGKVVEIAQGVARFKVGDTVASGAPHVRRHVLKADGDNVWKVPDGIDHEAATFTLLACTVLNGVRIGGPQLGDSVAVVGVGMLGQMACQFAKLFGARPVIALDLDEFRLDLARRIGGATRAIRSDENGAVQKVRELTGGRGADLVIEVVGIVEVFNLVFDIVRRFGHVVNLSCPRQPGKIALMEMFNKVVRVDTAFLASMPSMQDGRSRWHRRANGELILELLREGSLNFRDLVTHRFPYTEARAAYEAALGRGRPALGVILQWPHRGEQTPWA